MADPLKLVYSLDRLAQQHAVFEPDQVLTHGQLNSVTEYFDDQGRLTRVDGLGVGIVNGLRVGRRGEALRITRGFGFTTDGDLLRLPQDGLFTHWRAYDTRAPIYDPFWRRNSDGNGEAVMMDIAELLPDAGEDPRTPPLADLPGGLAGKVVVLLMESVVNDPDLCTGTDCDNLGRDALHRLRVLLLDTADAQDLAARGTPLQPASARAAGLPEALAERPVLARDITTTGALAARLRAAGRGTLKRVLVAINDLARTFPDVLDELFDADPSAEWRAILERHAAAFDAAGSGHQLWLSHLRDVVETLNTVREELLADDSMPLPDPLAFPKHLLLGRVDAPREQRTGFFPSPVDSGAREHAMRARFALWKLHVLLHSFALPEDTALRVTPSQGEGRPLEDRAIPWTYRVRDDLPVHVAWNYRLAARREPQANLGYRAAEWRGSERALTPLAFGIAGHDFFRVEGHLGRPVKTVMDELQGAIAAHNLPFQVQAVLLHNDRRRIVVKPGIRYNDLHRLHHLVRTDVALRIEEGSALGERLLGDVSQAVADKQIVAAGESGESAIGIARNARDAVSRVKDLAAPALTSKRYSAYRADTAWKGALAGSVETIGQARVSLGHVARTDFTSAFDSLIATNQPHWIDWLDVLIQAGDDRADEKLLFPRFVQQHPGLDSLGGCWRGGTFVLAYDDAGRVVADFTLPYACAEIDEDEPEEPPLTRPPFRPPTLGDKAVRVIPPVALQIDSLLGLKFADVRKQVTDELAVKTANIEGLVKGVLIPQGGGKVTAPVGVATGDLLLDQMVLDVEARRVQVESLRELASRSDLPPEVRTQAEAKLRSSQNELAVAVTEAADRAASAGAGVTAAGLTDTTRVLSTGVTAIRDSTATATLKTGLDGVETRAVGSNKDFVGRLKTLGGLRG